MLQIQVLAIRQSGEHSSRATGSTETDADCQEDPEDLRSLMVCRDSAHHPGDPGDR